MEIGICVPNSFVWAMVVVLVDLISRPVRSYVRGCTCLGCQIHGRWMLPITTTRRAKTIWPYLYVRFGIFMLVKSVTSKLMIFSIFGGAVQLNLANLDLLG